ncbi:MAG: recombinase family protein [Rubrobacter sp.]|nr:recombinase family protein [Rubrobacter sp.]
MPDTNGSSAGPKLAILYARVSTQEQASKGYSLAQQLEALRAYASREGYEVLEEVSDPGQSGASMERPGMDRVRDLVSAGEPRVAAVLAQDRDRFAREPAYLYLLREELAERGSCLQAMNDRGDESPEGQLTDGILDQLAKFERAKTAERTRRGKNRKAREGKIVAVARPVFGFKLNGARDAYEVDEDTMPLVRRIFREVGVEGKSLNGIKTALERERIESPTGLGRWNTKTLRLMIFHDAYLARPFEEVRQLFPPEVAARLEPEARYGVSWWGKNRSISHQTAYTKPDGTRGYRRRQKLVPKPAEEWIGVPIPDSGIPADWVYAGRRILEANESPSSAGYRFWELSGGVLVCGGCGWAMRADRRSGRKGGAYYHYYRCGKNKDYGAGSCEMARNLRAEEIEDRVWTWVKEKLLHPESLRTGLERLIETERAGGPHGDPERLHASCLRRISELDAQRSRAQDLAVEGLLSAAELRERLAVLQEQRSTLEREAAKLRARQETLTSLEAEAENIMERYAAMVPEGLVHFTAEDRHEAYRALRLKITAGADGSIGAAGVLTGLLPEEPVCLSGSTRASSPRPTRTTRAPTAAGRRGARS